MFTKIKFNFKKFFSLLILFSVMAVAASAQSPFKRLPKPTISHGIIPNAIPANSDLYAFRAIVNVPSYTTDNALLMGTGAGYGHYKYNPDTDKMEAEWTINALIWDKVSLDGSANKPAWGVAAGVWNNRILVGVATAEFRKYFATIGIGININNN